MTTVVMEATSDYWKPFYYLLEETLPVMLVNVEAARNTPDARPMSPTQLGWPNSPRTAASGVVRAARTDP